mgnify:FL=1
MRFAIYGTGGVGGYFGGRLAQAGHEVTFIARGAHLEAICRDGLKVESILGDFTIQPARAESDPAAVGTVDVVVVGVKTWQVEAAGQAIRPLVGASTLVLPLQNGVEAPGQLAAALDAPGQLPHVLGGLCRLATQVAAPGVIRHSGIHPQIAFNRLDGQPDERVEALRQALAATGSTVEVPADIQAALWAKFAFIAPFGGVGAAARVPMGVLRSVPETRQLLVGAIAEVAAVGRALGVNLPAEVETRTLAMMDSIPAGTIASMQRDIMEGRPSELEAQTGAVVRLGAQSGVATPVNTFLYAVLLPMEGRARSA